jgi:hypothetical protein
MLRSRCLGHLRLTSRHHLRSFIHSQRTGPSSAYLNPSSGLDESTTSTPHDLSPSQRRLLEAALRVDQAGEVAANYIYKGQLAVLQRDPATAALIQASSRHHPLTSCVILTTLCCNLGYVGTREKAPRCHEQASSSASSTTNGVMGGCEGSWVRTRCRDSSYGKGGGNGVHRGS